MRQARVAVVGVAVALLLGACGVQRTLSSPSLRSPVVHPPGGPGVVTGPISSPGGPFLYDRQGRVVLLHGVNAVYKRPPYQLYPDPGAPWDLSAADASLMARMGVDVVRLGMTWKGLEPGTAPANDPRICARGTPRDPGQYSQRVLDAYLARLTRTVALLGRFHIYSLLDMHQDVYNERFDGEGAPDWAVCTDGVPDTAAPGRWTRNYGTVAAGIAYDHFWNNDVVGDLQGEYDRVWAAVAAHFRGNPWVIGYDPFNEPFSRSLVTSGDEQFDAAVECFYTGTAAVGKPLDGAPPLRCAPHVPAAGVIPRILSADPGHLVFYEPDIFANRGRPNFVGPMDFPNLVFNVHVYCAFRDPVTGNPSDLDACLAQDQAILRGRAEDRTELGSPAQPGGPAWFVSEFGATSDPTVVGAFTALADRSLVGWAFWSWKRYDDPTGSADEGLVAANGRLRATALDLARTYPEAVAGTPTSLSFEPTSGTFRLAYRVTRPISAPTLIFVPTGFHYPAGYCARVTGGSVVSRPGASHLEIANAPSARTVRITLRAGRCPKR